MTECIDSVKLKEDKGDLNMGLHKINIIQDVFATAFSASELQKW